VERLAEDDVLNARALLAHCVHLDDAEIELVRSSGATAVHNPRSNMNNAVGYARVRDLHPLALGTDGIAGDMFAESRAAFWRARESGLDIGPQWALDRLAESARFAGAVFGEPLLGRIEPGAKADLAVLEYEPPTPLVEENLAGHWMFGPSGRNVRDVLVNGEEVVRDRRLVRADEPALRQRSREAADRPWRRMEEMGPHPFEPAGAGMSAALEES
jgi:cytosine/adenosine deaminase-related metal-dependent hydrolase